MRHHKKRGLSTIFFLATGIVIGVIIVILSASIIKWKQSARSPEPSSLASPASMKGHTSESNQSTDAVPSPDISGSPAPGTAGNTGVADEATRVDLARDPVCGKMVNPNTDMKVRFKGKDFFFCSDICMRTFKDDPFPYIDFSMKVNISIEPVQKTPGTPDEAGTAGSDTSSGTLDTTVKTLEPLTKPADTGTAPVEHSARPSDSTPKTVDTPPAVKKPPVKTGPVIEEIPLSGESKPPETRTKPPKTGGITEKPQPGKKNPGELKIEEIPLE
jgi:YHS domain-containing protein